MKQHASTVLQAPHFGRARDSDLGENLSRIEREVRFRLREYVTDFRLEFQDRGLVLCGTARTYYAKQLAQHAVMEATELPILINAIAVA